MERREFMGGLTATLTTVMAGCQGASIRGETGATTTTADAGTRTTTAGSETTTATTSEPAVLGTADDPWLGYVVHVSGDSSTDVREVFEGTVRRVLVGEHIQSVFVTGESAQDVANQVQSSSYTLESITSTQWESGSVCAINSRTYFPKEPAESKVRSAFPDAVSISPVATAQDGRFWLVWGRLDSRSDIESRLSDLGVDVESATVYLYTDCKRFDG